ncbi:uncharacterized protein LOC133825135 [Humulus lupulus]|uniref:uncharacterized protein LOC133825135 n=1 Tax=Humulus lupulus TaxID=3486 RepID=UPI002B40E682|nr:uncharacterized protein LOC133825135 [Humulus lupulus]
MDNNNTLSWNVRGLNSKNKQQVILDVCGNNKVGIGALIETKLKGDRIRDLMNSSFVGWKFYSSSVVEGCILLIWKAHMMKIEVIQETSQLLHCRVSLVGVNLTYFLSVVYGSNQLETRKSLWSNLANVQRPVTPWLIMGDFNAVFYVDDRLGGRSISVKEMEDARHWLALGEATEMKTLGPKYTWTNKQDGGARIYSKMDRVFSNDSWFDSFPLPVSYVQWDVIYDHCYLLIKQGDFHSRGVKPFQFFNMWAVHENSRKLFFIIAYFHASLKKRQLSNHIISYVDANECFVEDYAKVVDYYFHHFKNHLGNASRASGQIDSKCISNGPVLSLDDQLHLIKPFTYHEVRSAMFSINSVKIPGLDGYGAGFFKVLWKDIGKEISVAILDFFISGKIPSALNDTILSLIPKVDQPSNATEYRSIACCNTFYKCFVTVWQWISLL